MKRLLITGGTGILGQGLCATVPKGWSVLITHLRTYSVGTPGIAEQTLDVRNRPGLERLMAEHRFDAVVHAAGIANVDYSERHVDESVESNIGGTRNVAELCAATGTRMIYLSTNAVFGGTNAPYRESDPVKPVNAYGRIKVACERVVQETLEHPVIVRPILIYGWPHAMGRPNPVTWVIDSLERGETLHVVNDVFENPLYNISAALAIWAMLEHDIDGIIHLAGRDAISRYEMARMVARIFELDESRIRGVSSAYFPDIAPRPPNTTLVTTRMESELGIAPSSLEESLRLMASQPAVRR